MSARRINALPEENWDLGHEITNSGLIPLKAAVSAIIRISAEEYGLTEQDLLGRRRTSQVYDARMIAMMILLEHTPISFEAVAKIFHRDRSAVNYVKRAFFDRITYDKKLQLLYSHIKSLVRCYYEELRAKKEEPPTRQESPSRGCEPNQTT